MGSYLLTFALVIFAGNTISLRPGHLGLLCLWLKYAFFVNSKHYSRSNGTKGNFKPRKYLFSEKCLTSSALGDMFFRRTRWIAAQSQEVHLIENRSTTSKMHYQFPQMSMSRQSRGALFHDNVL